MQRKLLLIAGSLAFFSLMSMPSVSAVSSGPETDLIGNATLILQRAVTQPAPAIPESVMRKARAIAVFPGAVDDGTAYCGIGIVSARGDDPAQWTPPAVVELQGAIPVRLDVSAVDLVLVALTPDGVSRLTQPGMDPAASFMAAPGTLWDGPPEGVDPDLVGYMQFGDFFAGITVSELQVRELPVANGRLYGNSLATADVFRGGFAVPNVAQAWRNAITAYFKEMS